MNKIKIGIVGYGNIGRGVEQAIKRNDDMELAAVFTRRDPATVSIQTEGAAVKHFDDMVSMKGEVDVMILCGGSATDLPVIGPEVAASFNTIDSFDTHAKIPEYFANVDKAAKEGNNISIISVGWDPGMFSLNRLYAESILVQGSTYTFWGKGVSQGHSDAIRRIDGVKNAIQYTVPIEDAVEYDENGKPDRLDAVVLSTQHDPEVTQEQIHEDIKKYVFDAILPQDMVDENTKFFINPTGRFVIGGPHGDSGLTGRKIIVDTYGGYARHGGGAFSGKDCTKVDRSAAYAARYVAKNIVAAGLADKCEIQLSYAIGVAQPTSIMVDTFGTGKIAEDKLVDMVRENFDLRPAGIIKMLDLRRPIYKQTAAYGHFGRNDLDLPWEKLDKAETLKKYL